MNLGYSVIFCDTSDKNLPNFTLDTKYAVENSNISFICVPTPTAREGIDLSYIKEATKNIAKALANKGDYHVVVVKSTVVPTTTEKVIIPLLEQYSGKRARDGELGICANPEFLTQMQSSWTDREDYRRDFFTEERIVIGEYDKRAGDALAQIYQPLNKPVFRTDLRTAEMIKPPTVC